MTPCSTVRSSASITKSSVYLTVRSICPPILKSPKFSRPSLVRYSLYNLNRIGDKQHPCLTSLPIFHVSCPSFGLKLCVHNFLGVPEEQTSSMRTRHRRTCKYWEEIGSQCELHSPSYGRGSFWGFYGHRNKVLVFLKRGGIWNTLLSNQCTKMHKSQGHQRHIKNVKATPTWVLLGPAWCKLFCAVFITLSALHVSDVIHIHPQERYKMYMQLVQVSARVSWPVPRCV